VYGRLTLARLERHFAARDRADVLGLHTADAKNLSKGGGLDIDHHGPTSTAAALNLQAALHWYRVLAARGFHPLLVDSNGAGGFHLRVLLAEAIPAERVYHLLRGLTGDHRRLGFPVRPEQFPKQPDCRRCDKGLGNWLRAPGMHHKRPFWSKVWNGSAWVEGGAAIDFMLALTGDPPGLVPAAPLPAPAPRRRQYAGGPPGNLSSRIAAYVRRVPNLGEGQGRDDAAFKLAAWLVRDMALSDDIALEWLCIWDAGNQPPKGRECLAESWKYAHAYGRKPVGCGRDNDPLLRPGKVLVTPGRNPGHVVLRTRREVS
jgi:hypothetical protein